MKTNLDQIKAGADIHAGDGGYSLGTQKAHDEFVKNRNRSLVKARIRQFEKESKLEIFGLGARKEIWEAALEKYAELIVRECALLCSDPVVLLQHFGLDSKSK